MRNQTRHLLNLVAAGIVGLFALLIWFFEMWSVLDPYGFRLADDVPGRLIALFAGAALLFVARRLVHHSQARSSLA